MAIVSSYGALTALAGPAPGSGFSTVSSGAFYDGHRRTYAQLYKTQPAVRTVVDFFARNIAQLGLHFFERREEDDRVRLGRTRPLVQMFRRPNPATSRYLFFESTVQDFCIYGNAYWLKVRRPGDRGVLGLVRLPGAEMRVKGVLLPAGYVWEPSAGTAPQSFAPSEIVHFRMFDPENPILGYPPLETLRRVLAEEAAAAEYRRSFWANSARIETVITRPATAPKWQPVDKDEFRRQWQEFAGKKAGMTPVLEDGMTLATIGFNARDSQYLEARKLSREEVAAEYHVPLPMVGILDHATFSNIKEQHKQLYQDCLGPMLVNLEEGVELGVVPEFEDPDEVYAEFNIAEKLKGSFEEQADALSKAIGRPWMTANEGRARLNLPRSADPSADKLAEASPGQAAPKPAGGGATVRAVVERFARRQSARLQKDPAEERAARYDVGRWSQELAADLAPLLGDEAAAAAGESVSRATQDLVAAGQAPWSAARIESIVALLLEEARA